MAKRIHLLLSILIGAIITAFAMTTVFCDSAQKEFELDLNNDSKPEIGIIKNSIAYIYSEGEIIFESDPEWDVKEMLAGDFDNDGQNDFALSLWKKGNYGDSTPFWVEENDDSYKMHLFLYTWRRGKIAALWHSSNLPKINIRTKLIKTDDKQKNKLIVIENDYKDTKNKDGLSIATWKWNNWGFELEKRIFLKNFFSY